ncbi:hypothetical protein PROFUN_04692 [Planoprotostelium fungivorum]|uniref:MSP domain-containing protein n=1 Tax=Planoprotostelium fungivorum TaxID=1890364 RepID=A0A2P6NFT9_9EUKA|nr:hypothetical protein PROFUN_04692 [Planoprotostelium fungivorum]
MFTRSRARALVPPNASALPFNVMANILSQLSLQDILICRSVCRGWSIAADSDLLWDILLPEYFDVLVKPKQSSHQMFQQLWKEPLQCTQESITFPIPPCSSSETDYIQLKNTSKKHCLVYKVKTTSAKKYWVKPTQGIMSPNTTVEIKVVRQPDEEGSRPSATITDKFMILTKPSSPESAGSIKMDSDTKGLQKIRLAVTHRKLDKIISEREKVTPQKEKETPQKETTTKEVPKEKKAIDRQAEIKKVLSKQTEKPKSTEGDGKKRMMDMVNEERNRIVKKTSPSKASTLDGTTRDKVRGTRNSIDSTSPNTIETKSRVRSKSSVDGTEKGEEKTGMRKRTRTLPALPEEDEESVTVVESVVSHQEGRVFTLTESTITNEAGVTSMEVEEVQVETVEKVHDKSMEQLGRMERIWNMTHHCYEKTEDFYTQYSNLMQVTASWFVLRTILVYVGYWLFAGQSDRDKFSWKHFGLLEPRSHRGAAIYIPRMVFSSDEDEDDQQSSSQRRFDPRAIERYKKQQTPVIDPVFKAPDELLSKLKKKSAGSRLLDSLAPRSAPSRDRSPREKNGNNGVKRERKSPSSSNGGTSNKSSPSSTSRPLAKKAPLTPEQVRRNQERERREREELAKLDNIVIKKKVIIDGDEPKEEKKETQKTPSKNFTSSMKREEVRMNKPINNIRPVEASRPVKKSPTATVKVPKVKEVKERREREPKEKKEKKEGEKKEKKEKSEEKKIPPKPASKLAQLRGKAKGGSLFPLNHKQQERVLQERLQQQEVEMKMRREKEEVRLQKMEESKKRQPEEEVRGHQSKKMKTASPERYDEYEDDYEEEGGRGHISSLIQNIMRRPNSVRDCAGGRISAYDYESDDMEAGFDEIEQEEEWSREQGRLEDEEEARLEREMMKRQKKKDSLPKDKTKERTRSPEPERMRNPGQERSRVAAQPKYASGFVKSNQVQESNERERKKAEEEARGMFY